MGIWKVSVGGASGTLDEASGAAQFPQNLVSAGLSK
jgi:hypothetical protein